MCVGASLLTRFSFLSHKNVWTTVKLPQASTPVTLTTHTYVRWNNKPQPAAPNQTNRTLAQYTAAGECAVFVLQDDCEHVQVFVPVTWAVCPEGPGPRILCVDATSCLSLLQLVCSCRDRPRFISDFPLDAADVCGSSDLCLLWGGCFYEQQKVFVCFYLQAQEIKPQPQQQRKYKEAVSTMSTCLFVTVANQSVEHTRLNSWILNVKVDFHLRLWPRRVSQRHREDWCWWSVLLVQLVVVGLCVFACVFFPGCHYRVIWVSLRDQFIM